MRVKSDIRAVSGATISSRGMANGVRKVLALFDIFYGPQEVSETSPRQ
ncbi:MAG: FMN-binding protein [Candidatus Thorarchaeota archaeon]